MRMLNLFYSLSLSLFLLKNGPVKLDLLFTKFSLVVHTGSTLFIVPAIFNF